MAETLQEENNSFFSSEQGTHRHLIQENRMQIDAFQMHHLIPLQQKQSTAHPQSTIIPQTQSISYPQTQITSYLHSHSISHPQSCMHSQSRSTEHLQIILHPQPPSTSHPKMQSGGLKLQLQEVLQLQAILSAKQLQKIISMQEPQEVPVPLCQNRGVCYKTDC